MSAVTVKDSYPPPATRRLPRRMISIGVIAITIALLLGVWFIYFPWLLRSKVEDALRAGGVRGISFQIERATPWGSELTNVVGGGGQSLGIRRVLLDYSPVDLWEGKLDAIRVIGGRIELDARDGRIDFTPLAKLIVPPEQRDDPATTPPDKLPVSRIVFQDSDLVINTPEEVVTVPVDLSIVSSSEGKIVVDARLGPNRNMIVGGAIDLAEKSATFEGAASAGWTLLTVRTIWPTAAVGVDGFLQLAGNARWDDAGLSGLLRVEIAPPTPTTQAAAPAGKLQVNSGVFIVTANLASEGGVRLDVDNANFAVPDASIVGESVSGELVFNQLSPLATPPDQKFVAKKLSIGEMELTDGQVLLQMPSSDTINIRETRWNWLGGQVASQGIRVHASDPVNMTLQLRNVELEGLLELFAEDKASGSGKLSGVVPVTIDGSNIEFGDGRITALSGGSVQIKDAAAILPTAQAAASAAKDPTAAEQIKHNIIEALSDFVFERLTAQLNNEDGRLIGYVHMSGHGRTGAKQSIDYKLSVNNLDKLLETFLGIRQAITQSSTRKASP